MDYNKLPPGMYIQRGDSIKAITASMLPNGDFRTGMGNATPEQLAASVAWVFIALRWRRSQMRQIANVTSWMRNDEPLEAEQMGWRPNRELARIDWATKTHGRAIYRKQATRGRGFLLKWQDPASMKPDKSSANGVEGRYDVWHRQTSRGRVAISADELIVIQEPGMRELDPGTFAGQATQIAGQIMQSIGTTLDDFFDHNALPITLVTVPPGTSEEETKRLKTFFERTFSRFRGRTNKTMGVSADVTVTTLSLAPSELAVSPISEQQINSILLAHGAPISLATSVNKAEAGVKDIASARDLVAEAQDFVEVINDDPDVARSGVYLAVDEDAMPYAQAARRERSIAGQKLSDTMLDIVAAFNSQAFERVNAIAFATGLLGMDEELAERLIPTQRGNVFSIVAGGVLSEQQPDQPRDDERDSDTKALRKFIRAGKHYNRPFRSNVLTATEIAMVIDELDPHYREVVTAYP